MVKATIIPAVVDIVISSGTKLNYLITYADSLDGETFEAFLVYNDGTLVELIVVETDMPNGQMNLTHTSAKVDLIPVNVIHNWYLRRTTPGSERREMAGTFEVTKYKDV